MHIMIWHFSLFLLLAGIIFFFGRLLSQYGDEISERTGITGGWIGFILIAAVTSIPELASALSAVLVTDLPDMAVGDLLGSNLFNLWLLAPILFFSKVQLDRHFHSRVHFLKSCLGLLMLLVVIAAVILDIGSLYWVGSGSLLIWVVYFGGMKLALKLEKSSSAERGLDDKNPGESSSLLIVRFVLTSLVIIVSGVLLVFWCEKTIRLTGWNSTFLGALFLALATSLPEASVVLGALRIGAVEMGLYNIFGSNAFNLAIIPLLDAVYPKSSIFLAVSNRNLFLSFSVLLLTLLVIYCLKSCKDSHIRRIAFALVITLIYLVSVAMVFKLN